MIIKQPIVLGLITTWALSSAGSSPLAVAVLIAAILLSFRSTSASYRSFPRSPHLRVWECLLAASSPSSSQQTASPPILPNVESFIGLGLVSVLMLAFPTLALFLAECVRLRWKWTRNPWLDVLLPALTFAFFGILEDKLVGIGRTLWWIRGYEGGSGEWMRLYGGQVILDFLHAGWGASFLLLRPPVERSNNLLVQEEINTSETERALNASSPRSRFDRRLPFVVFTATIFFIGPLTPSPRFSSPHPSPVDPFFTYPPFKVACVVPPSLVNRHRRDTSGDVVGVEDWLKETVVVAGRGAKMISWSEGAIKLESSKSSPKEGVDGWEGMGESERAFLSSVANIASMHKVFILATYVLPAPLGQPSHKAFNVATLVGPRSTPDSTTPNIVFSTTKHLPVPFVEAYQHLTRTDPALASSLKALPLAQIELPHHSHTPSPHLTPHQTVDISTAICLDIASPSLFTSYIIPSHSETQHPRFPNLILNPSNTPLASLAKPQFEMLISRAIETHSWILRCDANAGISGLIGPTGEIRVLRTVEAESGSWEMEIEIEVAKTGWRPYLRIGEWGVLGLLALFVMGGTMFRKIEWKLDAENVRLALRERLDRAVGWAGSRGQLGDESMDRRREADERDLIDI